MRYEAKISKGRLVCTYCLDEGFHEVESSGSDMPLLQSVQGAAEANAIVLSEPLKECLAEIATRVTEKARNSAHTPWDGNEGDNYCCIQVTYDPSTSRFEITDRYTCGRILPVISRMKEVEKSIERYWSSDSG